MAETEIGEVQMENLETRISKWKASKTDLENTLSDLELSESKSMESAEGFVRGLVVTLGFFVVLYNGLAVLFTSKKIWPCFTAWIVTGVAALFFIGVGFPVTIAWLKMTKLKAEFDKLANLRDGVKSAGEKLLKSFEELRQNLPTPETEGGEVREDQLSGVDSTKITHVKDSNDILVQFHKQQNLVKVICVSLGLYITFFPSLAFVLFCGEIKNPIYAVVTFLQGTYL